jgi:hypothetical protein
MSFEEISVLLKAVNEKEKRQWERDRLQWFYSLIAPGLSKAKEPSDLVKFDWEIKKSQGRKISKDKARDIESKLEKIING